MEASHPTCQRQRIPKVIPDTQIFQLHKYVDSAKSLYILCKAHTLLEYGSVVWSPYLISDIRNIESVQRYYTRQLCRRCSIPFKCYSDRLYKLNLRSLEYRRLETDLIMVYKIIHGLVDIPVHLFFTFSNSPYCTRSHRYCLKAKAYSSQRQDGFFSYRVIPTWNRLPDELFSLNSFLFFKSQLKRLNLCDYSNIEH